MLLNLFQPIWAKISQRFRLQVLYCGGVNPSFSAAARSLALRTLEDLPERIEHTTGVAETMIRASSHFDSDVRDHLVASAWLHDIGYAAQVADTGFHPLDGARFVEESGYSPLVVSLVAFHSGATVEAQERGLAAELQQFAEPDLRLLDFLTFSDMTTGPTGEAVTVEARLYEILERYPVDDPVFRAITKSSAELIAAVKRVRERT